MAVRTLWFTNDEAFAASAGYLQWDGTAPSNFTGSTGWITGKISAGNYWVMSIRSIRATGYSTTPAPVANPQGAADDSFRLGNESVGNGSPATGITGTFAAGTWSIYTRWIAQVAGGSFDGRIRMRVWKGDYYASSGSVTELTSSTLVSSTMTNLATGASQECAITWSAPEIVLSAQFLFFQMALEITGAGPRDGETVIRFGSEGNGCKIVTPDYTDGSSMAVSGALGTVNVSAPEATAVVNDAVLKQRTCVGAGL